MPTEKEPEDFAALMAEYDRKAPPRKRESELELGQMVRGRVVTVGRDGAFVEIEGRRAEAMLDAAEVHDEEGRATVKVGDVVEARVVEIDGKAGCIVLRQSVAGGRVGKDELEQAFRAGIPVEGKVTAVGKGGVDVEIAGVRAFCPISQLDVRFVDDPAVYVGQKLTFRITRYEDDRRGPNLVVSRRALLEEEGRARADEIRGKLVPGAVVSGVVTSLKDYGAFIDLGGIEGMLHVSQIGFQRVARPADVLAVGQRVDVQILKIEKRDDPKRPEQISLSLKSLATDPWDEVVARLGEGSRVRGTVTRVETFGAFVELAPGVEGLAHASELAPGRQVRTARDLVKSGQALDVVVLSIDRDRRRISLGLGGADDGTDAADIAAAGRAGGQKLGTLGDLFAASQRARDKK